MSKEAMKPKTPKTPLPAHLWVRGRNGQPVCQCGRGHGSSFDGLCYTCRGGVTAWDARNKPYRLLQDNGSKYFGLSWDKAEQPAQQEPEFFTHNVEQPYDWSEWVCPDPKSYLMKCCDCGLVHAAEFGVVRYKSETEREDCEPVDDPNLQAVFRMRRSEQWSPADTAHRAGGSPMEQPTQRAWVGLTDEEFNDAISYKLTPRCIAIAIETKLKEKNT